MHIISNSRFLSGFAPFIDGTVLPRRPARRLTLPLGSSLADASGLELADFPSKQLLLGLTSTESYNDLSAQDLEFGFNETRRDRLLRTYVRNVYHFHLNEIFSALKVSKMASELRKLYYCKTFCCKYEYNFNE